MHYIYDILLNWNEDNMLYEFYEWKLNDDIEHIRKMPVIKVDSLTFEQLYYNIVLIDSNTLSLISNKTELYNSKKGNTIEYATIFTDGIKAFAVEFDKRGRNLFKSSLLLDEEDEVIKISKDIVLSTINYKIIKKGIIKDLATRFERDAKYYMISEFNKLYHSNNINKLRYFYYEWFGQPDDSFDIMYNKLKKVINTEWTEKHKNIYSLIKLSYIKK